ncbi:unnamed protein product [Spodoptera littoralis]|uniref:Uncharacterized protein n=1 Tax=Spodoptera littoralis TaxID=7109 RepID=A0A9P0IDA4_SPOLI|nr:unnamed protein product [Spodoptera littoralis]CAH1644114.1 unnamed protein product [Spodoptera littoralis]
MITMISRFSKYLVPAANITFYVEVPTLVYSPEMVYVRMYSNKSFVISVCVFNTRCIKSSNLESYFYIRQRVSFACCGRGPLRIAYRCFLSVCVSLSLCATQTF